MNDALHGSGGGGHPPGEPDPSRDLKSTSGAASGVDPSIPVWLALLVIGAFVAALRSPIDHAGSDPKGSLLTAQAILYTGSARLDDYAAEANSWVNPSQPERFVVRKGHIYYRHPMGSSLLAIPFVWMANLHGKDLHKPTTDADVQNMLSALMVAVSVLLSYSLCRRFISPRPALLLTAGFVFGSPLMSTMGTAYWNSGAASMMGLAAMMLLADLSLGRRVSRVMLAVLVVFALACRPTMLILVALSLPYVLYVRRGAFLRFALAIGAVLGLFALLHARLYDGFNLDYYRPSRLAGPFAYLVVVTCISIAVVWASSSRLVPLFLRRSGSRGGAPTEGEASVSRTKALLRRVVPLIVGAACLVMLIAWLPQAVNRIGLTRRSLLPGQWDVVATVHALYNALASPGRGLLIYSPYVILTVCGICARWRRLRGNPLFVLSLTWFVIHTLVVARPGRWHGGHCFGSRMYLDAFPAVMVLTLLAWQAMRPGRRVCGVLGVAVALAMFINTYQGGFNRWTILWNRDPNVDVYPRYLLSWRYPAFLASPMQIEARMEEHQRWVREEASRPVPAVPGLREPRPGAGAGRP